MKANMPLVLYMLKEEIGNSTLYLGDSREIMPGLTYDTIITDPPYGINAYSTGSMGGGVLARQSVYEATDWDSETVEWLIPYLIDTKESICFGGNYYELPPTSCWLIWNKLNGLNNFADFEMAWTNLKSAARIVDYRWQGMLRQNGETRGDHPTQKPIGVMVECVSMTKGRVVVDPFMGSGTTGVACETLGRDFIGIEISDKYFSAACRRIEDQYKNPELLPINSSDEVEESQEDLFS